MASTRKQQQVLVDQASSLTIFLDNRKPLRAFLYHVLKLYFIMSMKKKNKYMWMISSGEFQFTIALVLSLSPPFPFREKCKFQIQNCRKSSKYQKYLITQHLIIQQDVLITANMAKVHLFTVCSRPNLVSDGLILFIFTLMCLFSKDYFVQIKFIYKNMTSATYQ